MNLNNIFPKSMLPLLLVIGLWDVVWKGFAMWKAAKKGSKAWFILLMVINSIGILPIFYLVLNKNKPQEPVL